MVSLISGVGVIGLTGMALAALLPRGGRAHRFVGTEVEPYIAVAVTACVALGLTLMLSGIIELMGT